MPTRTATRTATRPFADWATFLDTVASEVRTGHSLRAAFTAALDRHHPDGTVLRPGAGVDDLHAAASLEPDEAMAIRALVTAARLGGPMAVGLHGAAAVIREREAVRAEAAAHSAQARLSARVLTAVPLVFCAWSWCTSASFRATMSTAPGVTAATLGGILNTTGWWWMRHIVRRAAQP